MNWSDPPTCELCGNTTSGQVAVRLIRWAHADPGMQYEHIHRCVDNAACRSRVEADGERWPIEERKGVTA